MRIICKFPVKIDTCSHPALNTSCLNCNDYNSKKEFSSARFRSLGCLFFFLQGHVWSCWHCGSALVCYCWATFQVLRINDTLCPCLLLLHCTCCFPNPVLSMLMPYWHHRLHSNNGEILNVFCFTSVYTFLFPLLLQFTQNLLHEHVCLYLGEGDARTHSVSNIMNSGVNH